VVESFTERTATKIRTCFSEGRGQIDAASEWGGKGGVSAKKSTGSRGGLGMGRKVAPGKRRASYASFKKVRNCSNHTGKSVE